VPLLLAEGDRDTYRREQAALEREKEIMKDVQGWEVCGPRLVIVIPICLSVVTRNFFQRLTKVYITMRGTGEWNRL